MSESMQVKLKHIAITAEELLAELRKREGGVSEVDRLRAELTEVKRQREDAVSRILKLETRLEMTHVYDGHTGERVEVPPEKRDNHFDGIACRDETIRGLKSVIEELTTERDALAQIMGTEDGE